MKCLLLALGLLALDADAGHDPRNIRHGLTIPDEGYCDQPYVVRTDDGHWLCVMTTGKGVEGESGQHIIAIRSNDHGKTWSDPVAIEPANGPEASWVMPLKVPGGRVYAFYTYNADNLRLVPNCNTPSIARRVDTLGQYVFKYSDDHGKTWSAERYTIPVREMRIDRENPTGGKIRFFWGVGKPIIAGDAAVFGFAKVGKWGAPGAMVTSQGAFLRSDNILTERDPARIAWETLPKGDEGLRAPKGPVSDEANLVMLSDGSYYATYRTIDGYNCQAYSRDRGQTWTGPEYASHTPGGRRLKHPRAANFVKKFTNGKYLLWFHNQGGEPVHAAKWEYYTGRNPAWICGGVERDGFIHWSEPEILLYDEDPAIRVSYPDFVEENGRYFVTETQKTIARVHEIDPTLLEGVWRQHENKARVRNGLVLEKSSPTGLNLAPITLPKLSSLATGAGFSLEFWIKFDELTPNQVLLDTRDPKGKGPGLKLATSERFSLRLTLSDGTNEASWDSDPGTHPGTLRVGQWQHVVVTVEAGPKIILFVVDGILNDGGAVRQFGWGRFPRATADINARTDVALAPGLFGRLRAFRVYDRPLRTSEAVGNFRAGMD